MDNPLGTWLANPLSSFFGAQPQQAQPPMNPLAAQVLTNPVGTSLIAPQLLQNATPIDPVVYAGPEGVLTASQLQAAQAQIAQARQTAATMALGMAGTTQVKNPIRAFHGSPYDFDAFDMSKVGTGEGAQAYGHGLYFAGNEAVARAYRDNLSGLDLLVDGRPSADPFARKIASDFSGGVTENDVQSLRDRLRGLQETYARGPMKGSSYVKQQIDYLTDYIPAANALVGSDVRFQPTGRMYEVQLNAEPHQLLDWDKPLAEQSPQVQRALMNFPQSHKFNPDWSGAQLYESSRLVPGQYFDKRAATQQLNQAGIPGIQYLDAGSRAAGEGSRNYVMFDPKLVSIVRKYSIPAAMLSGVGHGLVMDYQDSQ